GEPVCREHGRNPKVPTGKHGRGRRWQVEYTDPDGKLHYPCFDTEDQAGAFLVKVKADMLRGTYRDPGSGQVTLRKYALDVFMPAQGFDQVTRERVESALRVHILPHLGAKRLQEIEAHPSLVQAWVNGLPLAPSSAGRVFVMLNTIMRWARRDRLIGGNPCEGISLPRTVKRRIEAWTPETTAAVRSGLAERYRAFVDAGVGLGLRQSELFALAVEEVAWLPRVVHVRAQVKLVGGRQWFAAPKARKERMVPLATQTAGRLSAHLAAFPAAPVTLPWHEPGTRHHARPHTLTLLFSTPEGHALNRNTFNQSVWRPAREAAGLADDRVNGCHMMRHVYASTLVARGIDVRTVAEYLGHEDGGALVLKTYSHLLPDAEDRARRALEEALSEVTGPPATAIIGHLASYGPGEAIHGPEVP
ncbi:MAG TPA: tyrosine-type recombinase/integrase, partial [Streptosporangiaceae bacterium]